MSKPFYRKLSEMKDVRKGRIRKGGSQFVNRVLAGRAYYLRGPPGNSFSMLLPQASSNMRTRKKDEANNDEPTPPMAMGSVFMVPKFMIG